MSFLWNIFLEKWSSKNLARIGVKTGHRENIQAKVSLKFFIPIVILNTQRNTSYE